MSDNSRSDSNSSQKGRFGHLQARITPADASEMFKKSLRNISDKTRNVGAALQNSMQNVINSKKDASVYSKACRELDEFGYEKYNIDDEVEIFISKVPERALFNDGEPVIVRANDQAFVGTSVAVPKSAQIQMDEEEPVRDVHSLFSNVQTGNGSDQVISGCAGKVVNGEVQAVIDNTFLDRLSSSRPEPKVEAPAEVPVAEAPAEIMTAPAPVEVPVAQAPAEVPVAVAPAEDINIMQFEEGSDILILEPSEAVAATAVIEDAVEDTEEDDSWMFESDPEAEEFLEEHEALYGEGSYAGIDDTAEEVTAEIPTYVEEPAEVMSVPEPVAEAAAEAPVAEEPAEITAMPAPVEVMSVPEPVAEAAAEEPAEVMSVPEPVVEAPVEVPIAEAPAEVPVAEAPVVASVPTFRAEPEESNKIEGLYTEAEEATSAAATIDEVAAVAAPAVAMTSSEAMPVVNPLDSRATIKGMDESGSSILPPMTEPVKRRPGTMRFRFHNGVLQNIDDKKDESEEGLRGPFDVTVGQTVSQEADALRLPPVEIDDETDMMVITVPELDLDEDSSSVGFTGDAIPEDGMEVLKFAPAPVRRTEIDDEVGDIMMMTVPGLDFQASGFWEYEEIPDDGMEALCFVPEPVYDPACIGIGVGHPAIAAAAPVSRIGAPARIHALPAAHVPMQIAAAPEPVPETVVECLPEIPVADVAEEVPEEEPAAIPAAVPEVPAHGVTFGFGTGSGTGFVCFSF